MCPPHSINFYTEPNGNSCAEWRETASAAARGNQTGSTLSLASINLWIDCEHRSLLPPPRTHARTSSLILREIKRGIWGKKRGVGGRGSDFFSGTARYDSLWQSRATTVPYHSLERWVLDDCTCYFSRLIGGGWGVRKNLLAYQVSSRSLSSPVDVRMEPAVQLNLPSIYSSQDSKIDIPYLETLATCPAHLIIISGEECWLQNNLSRKFTAASLDFPHLRSNYIASSHL